MRTPVLLIVFNRPDPASKAFEAIRRAAPSRLYIAADGPRPWCEGERELCDEVRAVVSRVNWECRVSTRFLEENLGCRVAVSSAISWLFRHESEGIILEDDIVASSSFFEFATRALDKYRDTPRIWQISGNNFGADAAHFGQEDVRTVSLAQAWGWATWSDRWAQFEENPWLISPRPDLWRLSPIAKVRKQTHLAVLKRGLDAWDYQWQIHILNNRGESLVPAGNLVTNIGSGASATHTKGEDSRLHLRRAEDFRCSLPDEPFYSESLNAFFERKMGLLRIGRRDVLERTRVVRLRMRALLERGLSRRLLPSTQPIVVASTGRAGSTMLADALARAWSDAHLRGPCRFLAGFGRGWCDDLNDRRELVQPLLKTHALPPSSIELSYATKLIFLFGDPVHAIFSALRMKEKYGQSWFDEHQMHLGGQGSISEIFDRDVLGYCEQIYRWFEYRDQGARVLILDYDRLWDAEAALRSCLALPVSLPERRKRRSCVNSNALSSALLGDLRGAHEFARTHVGEVQQHSVCKSHRQETSLGQAG